MGVSPITALLGVYGNSGESRIRVTVRSPPSAARFASARAFGRSSSACAAAAPPRARATLNDVAALATAAVSEMIDPAGP